LRTLLNVIPDQYDRAPKSDNLLDRITAILPQRLTAIGGIQVESLCLKLLGQIGPALDDDIILRGLAVALLYGLRGPLHESELSPELLERARSIAHESGNPDVAQVFNFTLVGEALGSLAWLIRPSATSGRPGNSVIRLLATTARPKWGTYGESELGSWYEEALAIYNSVDYDSFIADDVAEWRSVVHLHFHALDTSYRLSVLDKRRDGITDALQKLHELARSCREAGLREEDTFLSMRLAKLASDLPTSWDLKPLERIAEALAVVHRNGNLMATHLEDLISVGAPIGIDLNDQDVSRVIQLVWDAVRQAYESIGAEMSASSRWRAAAFLLPTLALLPVFSMVDPNRWKRPELWRKALFPLLYSHPFEWRPVEWKPEKREGLSPVVTCGEEYAWPLRSGGVEHVTFSRSIWADLWQLPPSRGVWMVGPDGIRDELFGWEMDPEVIQMAGLYPTIRARQQAIRLKAGEDEIDIDAIDRINEDFTHELSAKVDRTHELIAESGLVAGQNDLVCSVGLLSQFPWEKSINPTLTHAHVCLEPGSVDGPHVLIDDPMLREANVAVLGDDPDLTMAADEIVALRSAYGNRLIIVPETTPEAIDDAAQSADILHITAHGVQAWRDPRENLLQFAENRIAAKEVAELDLSKVTLVVVNACNAGAFGINMNAGDATLAGAFIAAGAKAAIVALWEVEGSCAATFSAKLYASLAAGTRLTAAFHEATQALRLLVTSIHAASSAFHTDPFRLILRGRGVGQPGS